ncbi:hypothetical protein FRC09_006944 [Ceratobasidium sp. 395]|nr:hypothetical protein FRC09_006944 [Ceratobasidium sp. 395]
MATISGPGGSHVRLFEAFTGSLLWERRLHNPSLGRLLEPADLGVDVAFGRDILDIDAYVLTNAHTVTRLEGRSGKTVWTWTTTDISILISRVILSETHVITVGLVKTGALYGINIITLDRETGNLVSEKRLPSRITRGLQDVLILSTQDTHVPAIAWFDQPAGTLRSVTLESPDEPQYRFMSTNVSFSEALADIKLATLVDLPERKIASELGMSEHRGFADRLITHFIAAQNLPQFVVQFAKRFATGSYAAAVVPDSQDLERDTFGFRKMLVVATAHGTLIGVDTARGTVVWRRIIGFSFGGPVDVTPFKLFVVKSAVEGPNPEMVLVAERKPRNQDNRVSVVYHFEALTGRLLGNGRPTGNQVSDHGVSEAFLVPGESGVVGIVSTDGKINVYPAKSGALAKFQDKASSLHLALPAGSELHGYTIHRSRAVSHLSTVETWKKAFTAPAISPDAIASSISVIHRPVSPIASYGRVLGDRTTLYKYLSPHAAVVLAPDCAVRVVDLVSGTIVFDSGALGGEGSACEVPKVAFAENWLVYAYESRGNSTDKGTQVVSVELYEGTGKDDKISRFLE